LKKGAKKLAEYLQSIRNTAVSAVPATWLLKSCPSSEDLTAFSDRQRGRDARVTVEFAAGLGSLGWQVS
jgi:hypothetical protein